MRTVEPVTSSEAPGRTRAAEPAPGTMAAAVFAGPGEIEIRRVARPQPGPDEVRVRLDGCGVCASNLPVWEGREYFDYPFAPGAPGHEGWGIVDAVGRNVRHLKRGQRVGLISYNAFAQYDTAHADFVIPLPEEMQGMPFPAEPFGCAMNVFERAQIEPGQTVAIIGIGFMGAVLTALAARSAAHVIAISRRPFSRTLAEQCGAERTIPMEDHCQIIEEVRRHTSGRLCDCVIEAVGMQWPVDLAAELTGTRGRLVIAGYHQDGPRQVNMQMWNWRGLDVINAHERDQRVYVRGVQKAIERIQDGWIDPEQFVTHRYPVERMDEALRAAIDRPEGFVKGWIDFQKGGQDAG